MPKPFRVHPLIREAAALRRLLGLTCAEAATRVGLDHKTVLRWEQGATTPNLEALTLYLASYGLSLNLSPSDVYMKESSAA